jgi:hypothetical protein
VTDGQQMAASEPKPNWRSLRPGETVYILNDVIDVPEVPQDVSLLMKEQGMKIVSETAERIAREQALKMVEKIISETAERVVRDLAPGIVERVIREEIEKLKRESN